MEMRDGADGSDRRPRRQRSARKLDQRIETCYEDQSLAVHKLVVGPLLNNVHVLRCKRTSEAALIDAANEHDLLLDACEALGVRIVLQTHGHWDHVQAVPAMRDAGMDVCVSAEDSAMLDAYDHLLQDNQEIAVGRLTVQVLCTPGHTPGSLCFAPAGAPVLFSGDTLFPGGPGNTKLPGGDFQAIITSIRERIFDRFSDEVTVLPGHGAATTVGAERPHLDEWIERGW